MLKSEWEARQYPSSLSLEEDKASGWVYQFGDTHAESTSTNNKKSASHQASPQPKREKDLNNPSEDPVKKLTKRFMGKGIGAAIAILIVIANIVEDSDIGELIEKWVNGPEQTITQTDISLAPSEWTGTEPGTKIPMGEKSFLVTGAKYAENQVTYVTSSLESKHFIIERSDNYVDMPLMDAFPILEGAKIDNIVFDITDQGDLFLSIANSESLLEPLKDSKVITSELSKRFFNTDNRLESGVRVEAVFVDLNDDNRMELLMLYDNYVDSMVLEVYTNTGNKEKPFESAGFREVGRGMLITEEGYLVDETVTPHLTYEIKDRIIQIKP